MKFYLILIFLVSQFTLAQSLQAGDSVALVADTFIGIDAYNNTYFIKDNVLHKQGAEGKFVFNDLQLGKITSVDIINPLKVVVFYEDTNRVVLLDNKLSEIDRVNFNNLPEFINISAATNAGNNRLWIFNIDSQQLELYNYRDNRNTVLSQPFAGKLIAMVSNFNYCMTLTDLKLRTFNIYGSILSERDAAGFTKIVLKDNSAIALKENNLFSITEESIEPIKIPLSENTIKDLQLTQDFLYIYDGKMIHTFSITQPKK